MKITYLGHAALAIEEGDVHILVDPFISPNELAKDIDINSLKADYIMITHAHEDHIADVEAIVKNTGAKIISNYEIVSYYGAKGIEGHPMNHGGSWQFEFGKVTYTNAVHTSSFPDGSYGGQPGGFILETSDGNLYVAGDTALTMDMKLIPLQCKIDLAVLPIGDNFTMGIDSAIIASDFIECDEVLGYHYDTFGYIVIDHEEAQKSFADKGKNLILLPIGDHMTF
ncbi:metal-dependent hydrolase [Lutimonas saemankumensis]|uniref:metal-dependent hydrolase n=1 Tax=Lutimonas saemankumensis TaxID=483016 RepID=UPI001CD321FF|nr:metal-dependent hydrolase [Lutimonas saemankumensis]MCA0931251.1 metal-dependent hydrolase [Lutimonas saemankumensis]